jgi:predicted RNase H-like HicB family nuclease
MLNLSVLIEKAEARFVAHCLELDIVAAGDAPAEARRELDELICVQIRFALEHDNLEHLYHPAPGEYWAKYARAQMRRAGPRWSRGLDLQRVTPMCGLTVTLNYSYAQSETVSLTPA